MSTTTIRFDATLLVDGHDVPLTSELVSGDSNAKDGVDKGFLFKLDRKPADPPLTVRLGAVIDFISTKLGGGDLASNPGLKLVSEAFPAIGKDNFNAKNQTLINIHEFSLNSTTREFLFSFNLDVQNSNPSQGLIALPEFFASWLQIEHLAISFSASRKS